MTTITTSLNNVIKNWNELSFEPSTHSKNSNLIPGWKHHYYISYKKNEYSIRKLNSITYYVRKYFDIFGLYTDTHSKVVSHSFHRLKKTWLYLLLNRSSKAQSDSYSRAQEPSMKETLPSQTESILAFNFAAHPPVNLTMAESSLIGLVSNIDMPTTTPKVHLYYAFNKKNLNIKNSDLKNSFFPNKTLTDLHTFIVIVQDNSAKDKILKKT